MSPAKRTIRFFRSAFTLALFGFFSLGGAALSFLVLPFLRSRRSGHRAVRAVWRFLTGVFTMTGLIEIDASRLKKSRGRIIVANHPSLIDVVILTSFVPDVYSIAKSGLKRNPFFGRVVRSVMLANDERILDDAAEIVSSGGNVLIFPEGTRTPIDGSRLKLHRGAAQLAIKLGVPIAPVRIEVSRRILAKGQSILDMGDAPVMFRLVSEEDIIPPSVSEVCNRAGAVEMTRSVERAIFM